MRQADDRAGDPERADSVDVRGGDLGCEEKERNEQKAIRAGQTQAPFREVRYKSLLRKLVSRDREPIRGGGLHTNENPPSKVHQTEIRNLRCLPLRGFFFVVVGVALSEQCL